MHDATTLRSDENAWKLECSNIFSSGPQPLTVLRDIQVCCWIISKLVCLIFEWVPMLSAHSAYQVWN